MTSMKMPIAGDPEKLLFLSNVLYILLAVLTVGATFAIVFFGSKVSSVKQAQLKAYQSEADARIAEANEAAARANQLSDSAKAQAEYARLESAKANTVAQQAIENAALAHAQASIANAEAEASKTERARVELQVNNLRTANELQATRISDLQEKAKPRALTPEQQKKIIDMLLPFQHKLPVEIKVATQTIEGNLFAKQIEAVLTEAGFSVHLTKDGSVSEGFGVVNAIVYPTPENGMMLHDVFNEAGLECLYFVNDMPAGKFFVFVGDKRQSELDPFNAQHGKAPPNLFRMPGSR